VLWIIKRHQTHSTLVVSLHFFVICGLVIYENWRDLYPELLSKAEMMKLSETWVWYGRIYGRYECITERILNTVQYQSSKNRPIDNSLVYSFCAAALIGRYMSCLSGRPSNSVWVLARKLKDTGKYCLDVSHRKSITVNRWTYFQFSKPRVWVAQLSRQTYGRTIRRHWANTFSYLWLTE